MGSGINAAATMGRLRTATRTLADLDLDPGQVLEHLDQITADLEHSIATCVYAVLRPAARTVPHRQRRAICRPCWCAPAAPPELLDLPTGAPLGVGGVAFETTTVDLAPGDLLVLYTDGLVETRHHPIDDRLDALLELLDEPRRVPWRRSATCCCAHCAIRTTTTTSPCSSPGPGSGRLRHDEPRDVGGDRVEDVRPGARVAEHEVVEGQTVGHRGQVAGQYGDGDAEPKVHAAAELLDEFGVGRRRTARTGGGPDARSPAGAGRTG